MGADGSLLIDSWRMTGPTYQFLDPNTENWTQDVARALDRGFNVHRRRPRSSTNMPNRRSIGSAAWPEAVRALKLGKPVNEVRNAPDLTPVISSAVPFDGGVLLATDNDRTFTQTVRRQRA